MERYDLIGSFNVFIFIISVFIPLFYIAWRIDNYRKHKNPRNETSIKKQQWTIERGFRRVTWVLSIIAFLFVGWKFSFAIHSLQRNFCTHRVEIEKNKYYLKNIEEELDEFESNTKNETQYLKLINKQLSPMGYIERQEKKHVYYHSKPKFLLVIPSSCLDFLLGKVSLSRGTSDFVVNHKKPNAILVGTIFGYLTFFLVWCIYYLLRFLCSGFVANKEQK